MGQNAWLIQKMEIWQAQCRNMDGIDKSYDLLILLSDLLDLVATKGITFLSQKDDHIAWRHGLQVIYEIPTGQVPRAVP
jgi:hypothetical protein